MNNTLALTAPLSFGTFVGPHGDFPGVLSQQRVLPLDQLRTLPPFSDLKPCASMLDALAQWPVIEAGLKALQAAPDLMSQLDATVARDGLPLATLALKAPVMPRQIFMCGANYFKHVVDLIVDQGAGANPGTEGLDPPALRAYAEALMRRRQRESYPYFFNKPVSTLTGPNDPVILPAWAKQPDWELELAVVIGRRARHVRLEDALSHVAGYTIGNDISNRDHIYERGDMKALGTNWVTGKSCPTYLPLGPVVVPAAYVPDPQQLRIQLKLNGQVMQDETTGDMIFGVARQIEYLSSVVELWPGDVICTGSPAGNGTHYKRFLQHGDTLECSISGLGTQYNPVRDEQIAR